MSTRTPDELHERLHHRQSHQQNHQQNQTAPRHHLVALTRSVVGSTGAGFIYGAMLGGVLATAHGLRDAPPPLPSKLRGALLRVRAEAPRTAGRVALVACAFRLATLALARVRGGRAGDDMGKEDLWGVLLAAPLAGAALRVRHGPRVAFHSALSFGSVAAVMLAVHAAERAVERRWPEEASAEEEDEVDGEQLMDEVESLLLLAAMPTQSERRQGCSHARTHSSHRRHSRHSDAYEAREVLEEIAFAEELDE